MMRREIDAGRKMRMPEEEGSERAAAAPHLK